MGFGISSERRMMRKKSLLLAREDSKDISTGIQHSSDFSTIANNKDEVRFINATLDFLIKFKQMRNLISHEWFAKVLIVFLSSFLSIFTTIVLDAKLNDKHPDSDTHQHVSNQEMGKSTIRFWLIILMMNTFVWVFLHHFIQTFRIVHNP